MTIADLNVHPFTALGAGDIHRKKPTLHFGGDIEKQVCGWVVFVFAFVPILETEKWLAIEKKLPNSLDIGIPLLA